MSEPVLVSDLTLVWPGCGAARRRLRGPRPRDRCAAGRERGGEDDHTRALCGMVDTKGSVRFEGTELVGKAPDWIVRRGIAHVPQGRGTFPELTVEENLQAGVYIRKDHDEVWNDVQRWLEVFPRLGDRRGVAAGSLSGGEQQMLASPGC